jgi:hypothetical protein
MQIEESDIHEENKGEYPLARVPFDKVHFIHEGMKGWHFISVNDAPLCKSIESAKI